MIFSGWKVPVIDTWMRVTGREKRRETRHSDVVVSTRSTASSACSSTTEPLLGADFPG